ncbi:MAG TPA: mechanosensitive ion channel domain-containing protein [Anaerolineales bacterium]|nr:mechanosensitive ion channel domain-containing protein [Anaerolineales bacterium]
MSTADFQVWVEQNLLLAVSVGIILSLIVFLFTRNIIARGLIILAGRTSTRVDDILVKHLRPFRIAWLAPLAMTFAFAYLFPENETLIKKGALFFILWVSVVTLNALLDALNEIYESRPNFNGVSIQSYLDIAKIALVLVAIILSISLLSGESPLVLLTGLGALTAVLLLIFQNTILSLVASIQIATHDLIKEGDWIEVPSYEADGDVVNISLHTIKIQNFDKTFTVIPTYKITEVAYKNWRGMTESGGRRIQRSLLVDMNSIKFCDEGMLRRLSKIDLIQHYLQERIASIETYQQEHGEQYDSPLDGPQITNTEIFRRYIVTYLKSRPDIHQDGMPFLVRTLALTPAGLPIELYIFTRTTQWEEYEGIQAEIFDHLLAAAGHFDLRVFQEPTGMDFANFARGLVS